MDPYEVSELWDDAAEGSERNEVSAALTLSQAASCLRESYDPNMTPIYGMTWINAGVMPL